MFTLIRKAHVFAPEVLGVKDILICNEKFVKVEDSINFPWEEDDLTVIDGVTVGEGGEASYDDATHTLTLENATIDAHAAPKRLARRPVERRVKSAFDRPIVRNLNGAPSRLVARKFPSVAEIHDIAGAHEKSGRSRGEKNHLPSNFHALNYTIFEAGN